MTRAIELISKICRPESSRAGPRQPVYRARAPATADESTSHGSRRLQGGRMKVRFSRNRTRRQIATLLCLIATIAPAPVAQAAGDSLIMGVFPRRNATETTKLFTPMADHLGEQLGRKVELVTAKDFESFWQGVMERRYDIVHY